MPNLIDGSHMFSDCSNLRDLSGTNIITPNVKKLDYFFQYAGKLTDAPMIDTSNVTDMTRFAFRAQLRNIPQYNTSKVTTFEQAFSSSNFTNASLENVMNMCAMAVNCINKTLANTGLNNSQLNICKNLPSYQNFINAGWTLN
jgi:hypothetical protein